MKKLMLLILFFLSSFVYQENIQANTFDVLKKTPYALLQNPYTVTALAWSIPVGYSWYYGNTYEQRWDWDTITFNDLIFPKDFKWGVSSSDLQISGLRSVRNTTIENSWSKYELEHNIPEHQKMGLACDHWGRYKEDFSLAHDFGLQIFRYSIEWSKIQPNNADHVDEEALEHYVQYTKALIDAGLEPMPTLFHHAWPLWFDDLGAFEKAENVEYFVKFATYVFEAFKKAGLLEHTKLWLTFNEPAGYTLGAYIYGKYPPNKKIKLKAGLNMHKDILSSLRLCGNVLKNMLDAHIAIYHEFKKRDESNSIQISLAHMMQPIQPYNPWNPIDKLLAGVFNHLLNNVTLQYLRTGQYNWLYLINERNPAAINALDFIGVNYYTNTLISGFKDKIRSNTIISDEGGTIKSIYAEGLYYAMKNVAYYFPEKPFFITENGFATNDIEKNKIYFDRHLYVVRKLIDEGINIRGYLWWTLLECFSWSHGNGSKYGLYHVDYTDKNLTRTLKDSSLHLKNIIAQNKAHYA